MHTDEAVNAYIVGEVLSGETYRYDPQDRHGPALTAIAVPMARLSGAHTFADLNESILRMAPVLLGAATILLFAALAGEIGFVAALAAATFFAVGPLPVYYSRYFIHETLFVAATFGLMMSGWRALSRQSWRFGAAAGICAGIMLACKETAFLHFAALAGVGVWWMLRRPTETSALATESRNAGLIQPTPIQPATPGNETGSARQSPGAASSRGLAIAAWVAAGAFLVVVAVFYTSAGRHWRGPLDLILSIPRFAARAAGEGHEKPIWYYGALLGGGWSGSSVMALAVIGAAGMRRRLAVQCLVVYAVAIAVIYSSIPYKTPWLALNLWLPMAILGGCGFAVLWQWAVARWRRDGPAARPGGPGGKAVAFRQATSRALLLAAAFGVVTLLGRDTWQRAFADPADERNPYAYAHTGDDLLRLPGRMAELARAGKGNSLRVAVVAADPWPLPWYLRRFPNTGFWQPGQDPGAADVYITSPEAAERLADRLQGRRPEFFGLRPEVLMILWSTSDSEGMAP